MKKAIFVILVVITISLIVVEIQAKKKKHDEPEKPVDVSQELYCNACQAIIQEVLKKVRQSRSETDIVDALSGICHMKNFYVYEFTPPEMKKGCDAFFGNYEEQLEKELMRRDSNDKIVEQFCTQKTKVCEGVVFQKPEGGVKTGGMNIPQGMKLETGKGDPNFDPTMEGMQMKPEGNIKVETVKQSEL